ncbi:hypothetical protein EC968_008924 [Mortierella alpina]|nr:hypothetical protein EC968_008924 [Mortierella alpina]
MEEANIPALNAKRFDGQKLAKSSQPSDAKRPLGQESVFQEKGGLLSPPTLEVHKPSEWFFRGKGNLASTGLTQDLRLPQNKILGVAVYYDSRQHYYGVFWDDVLGLCKDSQYLLDGDTIVPFITDDNFEYVIPLRFAYVHGVVMNVMTEKSVVADEVVETMDSFLYPPRKNRLKLSSSNPVAAGDAMDKIAPYSKQLLPAFREPSDSDDDDYEDWDIQSPMCESPPLTDPTKLAMDRLMATSVGDNDTVNKRHTCSYPSCGEIFVTVSYKVVGRQQEHSTSDTRWISALKPPQKPVILSQLQQKIKSVVFRNYRIHELSTPRLFILLPEKISWIRMNGGLRRFRLFFLCDSAEPTSGPIVSDKQTIHLSSNKGYQIRDMDAFFDKYGTYALTIMEYVKHGYQNPEANIPPMNLRNILDPMRVGFLRGRGDGYFARLTDFDLEAAVDETIDFLQNRLEESHWKSFSTTQNLSDNDHCEAVDLRQLTSFLDHQHDGGVPGSLYRTITKNNGCVKWMCLDHHRQHYPEDEFLDTKAIIEEQGGTFDEQLRRIHITAQSNDYMRRIRRVIQCTRDLQEISIRIEWPVRLPDLLGISLANDTRLVIDGSWLDGHQETLVHHGSDNYSPATCVELRGSRLLPSLCFRQPLVRVLTLTTSPFSNRPQEDVFPIKGDVLRSMLSHAPNLVELELTVITLNGTWILDYIVAKQASLPFFRLLTLTTHQQDVASIFFNHDDNPKTFKVVNISIVFGPSASADGRTKFNDLFRQYGWCIQSLDTNDTFVDHHATILAIPVKGAEYRLTNLILNAVSLSAIGLGCLDVIIYRAINLQRLSLILEKLHDEEQFEKAILLQTRYETQLTRLTLSGDTTTPWITKFAEKFPTRYGWPRLGTFRIICPLDWNDIDGVREEWDAEIVAAPLPQAFKTMMFTTDMRLDSMRSFGVRDGQIYSTAGTGSRNVVTGRKSGSIDNTSSGAADFRGKRSDVVEAAYDNNAYVDQQKVGLPLEALGTKEQSSQQQSVPQSVSLKSEQMQQYDRPMQQWLQMQNQQKQQWSHIPRNQSQGSKQELLDGSTNPLWQALIYHESHEREKAWRIFKAHSDQRNPEAMYWTGYYLFHGEGGQAQDRSGAFEMFRTVTLMGLGRDLLHVSANAHFYTAVCYLEGYGVDKNLTTGFGHMVKGADSGNAFAQYLVGDAYQKGSVMVQVDLHKRDHYWQLAARQNEKRALEKCRQLGIPV